MWPPVSLAPEPSPPQSSRFPPSVTSGEEIAFTLGLAVSVIDVFPAKDAPDGVRSLLLVTGNEAEGGVDCTIASVGSRFNPRVIRFRIWREMRGFKAAPFDSKNPHVLAFVFC